MVKTKGAEAVRRAGVGTTTLDVLAGVLVAGWLAACAPGLRGGSGLRRTHGDLRTLTRDELAGGHFHNAYEAVQALRGNWLLSRPHSLLSRNEVVLVYLDNIRLGDISELEEIPLEPVIYIRYFDSLQATERWGVGHTEGVIYISTHPF